MTSRVWSLGLTIDGATGEATAGTLVEHTGDLGDAAASIASFGVDAGGELYVVNYTAGTVYRLGLVGGPPPGSCAPPDPYASAGGGLCADGNWYPPTPGGDFNGDHQPDLTWESTSGQVYVWFMNGVGLAGGGFTSQSPLPAGWLIAGTNDFTGDGHADLLVQNQSTGAAAIHVMNGLTEIGEQAIPIAANTPWRIVATGDFNTDGQADIVWENFSSGQLFVWFMGSPGGTAAFIGGGYVRDLNQIPIHLGPTSWRVVGTGDVNGDGHADLLWQDLATGSLAAWYLNGLTSVQGVDLSPARVSGSWQIRAVGDFNGDRHPDLIWQNPATGELYAWFLTGATLSSGGVLMPPRVGLVWQIVGAR